MENEILSSSEVLENEYTTVSENDYILYSPIITSESDFTGYALNTFDRIISGIPSYYGYYGFLTDTDAYLYYGSESSVNGSNISFGMDCKEVHLYENSDSKLQIDTVYSPNASFLLGTSDLCYTNLVSGFPTLGDNELSLSGIAALFLLSSALVIVFNRSSRR